MLAHVVRVCDTSFMNGCTYSTFSMLAQVIRVYGTWQLSTREIMQHALR